MLKVFILDDDEMQNYLNALLMKTIGITDVDSRTSAKEAFIYLDGCKKNNTFPDLILVDMNMIGMSGLTFVEQYERHYRMYSRKTHIIILTNSVFDEEKDEAMKYESVLDFWSKPLNKTRLLHTLNKISHNEI